MKRILFITALFGMSAVALGAFGAHGLKKMLTPEMLDIFKTGVQYQFYHTFALLAVALLLKNTNDKSLLWAARLFIAGILIFSGSLYLLSLTGIRMLGAITPLGGVSFIAGWALLASYGWKQTR